MMEIFKVSTIYLSFSIAHIMTPIRMVTILPTSKEAELESSNEDSGNLSSRQLIFICVFLFDFLHLYTGAKKCHAHVNWFCTLMAILQYNENRQDYDMDWVLTYSKSIIVFLYQSIFRWIKQINEKLSPLVMVCWSSVIYFQVSCWLVLSQFDFGYDF